MPRKQYRADLTAASTVPDFGHITTVKPGDDDGDLTFFFTHPGNSQKCQITAMVDTGEYPSNHDYQLFASDDASAAVANALQNCPSLSGRPIQEALPLLSAFLTTQTATGGQHDPYDLDGEDSDVEMPNSQSPNSDDDAGDNEDWALEDDDFTAATGLIGGATAGSSNDMIDPDESLRRTRADLRAVKDAGFKVGVLGNLSPPSACYVSVACRIAKLGISEEAQDAWGVEPSEYLILLLYFPYGYRALDFFEGIDAYNGRSRLAMSVGISDTYKPRSVAEAQRAFATSSDDNKHSHQTRTTEPGEKGFRECIISRPLNNLLNDRLTTILKYRLAMAFSWGGAERYYTDSLGASRQSVDYTTATYSAPEETAQAIPSIATEDEISKMKSTKELSFPLVAMQFLLRHFVRCTEFCLVCHSKLNTQVEAIKPYVCDNPLCLYQYMSLGFGPSIEHEIIAQPYVVDLLVSFCYASASCNNLSSYPDGLGLSVPNPAGEIKGLRPAGHSQDPYASYGYPYQPEPQDQKATKEVDSGPGKRMTARLDNAKLELLFDPDEKCLLRKGQWIVLSPDEKSDEPWHCRVIDTHLFPTVRLTDPILTGRSPVGEVNLEYKRPTTGWSKVQIVPYDQNINTLDKKDMSTIILLMLDLLPSVVDMKRYLLSRPGAALSQWIDRISPAALGILRWIIASNRSCIMQVDCLEGDETPKKRLEDRVQGLPGWLQFRFAMGAPDKEQRFVDSLKAETGSLRYPTIFAWHGSPLSNWHSIIREGLHFKKTSHGRAYGHGCYHAKDFGTSGGYSGMHRGMGGRSDSWPGSSLQISQAVALNEIVNAPEQFISNSPFYVVSQLDWIQTRYLFVKPAQISSAPNQIEDRILTAGALEQDPTRKPTGPTSQALDLPPSAIPKSRRRTATSDSAIKDTGMTAPGAKRPSAGTAATTSRKGKISKLTSVALKAMTGKQSKTNPVVESDSESVATAIEDLEILFEPEPSKKKQATNPPPKKPPPSRVPLEPVTPFAIQALKDLPLTPTPNYATTQASKRLQKDFRALLNTQSKFIENGTLSDLGWYVDPEHVTRTENLYQWIAELHSFPLTLPLAKDLQTVDMQSVILEIRFPATYPMSPPFVRVVRPRFLPFNQGGGGHVTAGGSICAQLLTNDGWTVVSDMESVLLQVRMAIMSLEPHPARIESVALGARGGGGRTDYGVGEAVEAFKRACQMHGWKVPEGLNEMASQSGAGW